jgi:hypothetical protein
VFNPFKPRCTVDPVTRRWIDTMLAWLADEFPDVGDRTILPTADDFPDPYDRSDDAVRTLLGRVCRHMHVDPDQLDLRFFSNPARDLRLVNDSGDAISNGAAGTYHRGETHFVIRIERRQAEHPMDLVGTVAHELAHVRLMGEGRVTGDEFDNELLTDLTVVHHGMGVFLANVRRHWGSHVTRWPGTDVPMPRYMTTPMYGYALAARSVLAGEHRVLWKRHLKPGVRAEFRAAKRFLCHFTPGAR